MNNTEIPTLRQLRDEGEIENPEFDRGHYSIDDGQVSNAGDGAVYAWKGRRFEVCIFNGAGDHAPGETIISEIIPEEQE